ncbi:MAG TPA: HAD-IIA family hydrolase [Gemmatimonadales bacterium]|nr:HAD-IIA family hydrolase [Gemmatimonadales bacterium]
MPDAFLFDLDGTLYAGGAAVPGAAAAVAALRARGIPCRFLTNTTTLPRSGLVARLAGFGFEVSVDEIVTPLRSATAILRGAGIRSVMPFVAQAALEDLDGFELIGGTAGGRGGGIESAPSALPPSRLPAVLIGDLGSAWGFDLMQSAFELLHGGARFVALSRDRYFQSRQGLTLDAGPFVAALEYATGRSAEVVGKPSEGYFREALATLGPGIDPARVAMVGDDLWSDIQGAQRVGCQAWLVRTGKFRQAALDESSVVPDQIIDSVAELGA